MSRKSILMAVGIVLLILVAVGGTLLLLVRHEPAFYSDFALEPGERQRLSEEFWSAASILANINENDDERGWVANFTDLQINSFLEEGAGKVGLDTLLLRQEMSMPRVAIEPDKARLAFRYGTGTRSTVISIEFRLWLVKTEPGLIALELQSLRAGSLPISSQSLLDQLSEFGEKWNTKVSWYRYPRNGNPVALLRLQADKEKPTVKLTQLELQQGKLIIAGRSTEASPLRAMLGPSASNGITN